MLNLESLQQAPEQLWRNGGGSTRELLAWPTEGDWQVRVSVATIAEHGPFSAFPGVARWFTMLDGAGVRLRFPNHEVALACGDEPHAFDGAEAPGCALIDGPTLDLNLMARHTAGRAMMQRALPGSTLHGAHGWRGLYAHGALRLRVGEQVHELPPGTLAWAAAPQASAWQVAAEPSRGNAGPAWWLALETR